MHAGGTGGAFVWAGVVPRYVIARVDLIWTLKVVTVWGMVHARNLPVSITLKHAVLARVWSSRTCEASMTLEETCHWPRAFSWLRVWT